MYMPAYTLFSTTILLVNKYVYKFTASLQKTSYG